MKNNQRTFSLSKDAWKKKIMKNPTNSLMKTNFGFRFAYSELELNNFFFVVIVCKGWCPWLNRPFKEKSQFMLFPLGYSDLAFFLEENISASDIILWCTSSQVQ